MSHILSKLLLICSATRNDPVVWTDRTNTISPRLQLIIELCAQINIFFFYLPSSFPQSSLGCAWTHYSTASSSQVWDCGRVRPLIASILFPDCHLVFYAKHWVYKEWISNYPHSYSQAIPGMLIRIHSESRWLDNVLYPSIERQDSWGMRRHRSPCCCLQIGLGILPNLSSS